MTTAADRRARREDKTVRGSVALEFRPRPRDRKDWRDAGFVPCDQLYGRLPDELLPGIAVVNVKRVIGDHAVTVTLYAESLTDDEELGASFAERKLGIVTFDEARAAHKAAATEEAQR